VFHLTQDLHSSKNSFSADTAPVGSLDDYRRFCYLVVQLSSLGSQIAFKSVVAVGSLDDQDSEVFFNFD